MYNSTKQPGEWLSKKFEYKQLTDYSLCDKGMNSRTDIKILCNSFSLSTDTYINTHMDYQQMNLDVIRHE